MTPSAKGNEAREESKKAKAYSVTKSEPMNKLIEIKEYVDREYLNLVKSKNRARSKIGIRTKRELLLYAVQKFEATLEEIKGRRFSQNF